MKVLLITEETWNDRIFANNVLQNWFEGMQDMEFAEICLSPGRPYNTVCEKYFQITDVMMLKSVLGSKRAGRLFSISVDEMKKNPESIGYIQASRFYKFFKAISCNPVRLMRELIWKIGRVNRDELQSFVKDFKPDIVFCPRLSTWKTVRIEKMVAELTTSPFVAFTGDDEASLREYDWSPLFWINRFLFRRRFKNHIRLFKFYFTGSEIQAKEYENEYGISTSSLYKSCTLHSPLPRTDSRTIKLVYAGRLYCNRWKTLLELGTALDSIQNSNVRVTLDIYTQDILSRKQRKRLAACHSISLKPPVSQEELVEVYRNSDIALHVESMDRHYRLLTRTSFSTKIVDLLGSGCAIMAICWSEHAGFKYLKDNDAAICISSYSEIGPTLDSLINHPDLISYYAQRARECAERNHNRQLIQKAIMSKFREIITTNI